MSKELIDVGVYQYDNLDEAIQDAKTAANGKRKETQYVVQDHNGYYGPINYLKRQYSYRLLTVAYTAEPEK
jgi:hypothetical protein